MNSGKSWSSLAGRGPRFVAIVRPFHYGMQVRVQNDEEFSEPFQVTNGVKQGCIMTEPHREKTGFLPRRKQRRRSASR